MRILAISGSLRQSSSNTAVVRAAAALAPPGVEIVLFDRLGGLPHFNPDLDKGEALPPIAEFRRQLQFACAVIISSPEYAHGVPGVMKNALDWVVGSGELVGKPVALINASPRSTYALLSLKETLVTMCAKLVDEASLTLPMATNQFDAEGLVGNAGISGALRQAVAALVRDCEVRAEMA